jgi:peptidoglycan/xylan/chitin deacetylase (PgdA/CDA1 family)
LACSYFLPTPAFADSVLTNQADFKLVRIAKDANATNVALQYLGDVQDAWQLSQLNGRSSFRSGDIIAIPNRPTNPSGVYSSGYRSIPILCYHQLSAGLTAKNRMQVTATKFEEQMSYLANNGYQVLPLSKMQDFLDGKSPIPGKAVILTFDDGFRSVYDIAFPILKKYGFTATLFVYTDLIGGSAALSWQQINELETSGTISIENHTKTHTDLSFNPDKETLASHSKRIATEIDVAATTIKNKVGRKPTYLAYPFGNSSDYTLEYLSQTNYGLALTVKRGPNSAFADPYLLQRTMIYNDHTLDQFAKIIVGFHTN